MNIVKMKEYIDNYKEDFDTNEDYLEYLSNIRRDLKEVLEHNDLAYCEDEMAIINCGECMLLLSALVEEILKGGENDVSNNIL